MGRKGKGNKEAQRERAREKKRFWAVVDNLKRQGHSKEEAIKLAREQIRGRPQPTGQGNTQTYTDKNGYLRYKHNDKLVHRVVAYEQIYLKNRAKYPKSFSEYVIHHKDGNKKNNAVSNLEILKSGGPGGHGGKHGIEGFVRGVRIATKVNNIIKKLGIGLAVGGGVGSALFFILNLLRLTGKLLLNLFIGVLIFGVGLIVLHYVLKLLIWVTVIVYLWIKDIHKDIKDILRE